MLSKGNLQKKVVCVLPAYNAAKTIEKTLAEVPRSLVDLFIIVDDASTDETTQIVNSLKTQYPILLKIHSKNSGYGANQKTCYHAALESGADIVVMLHPDYQYEPKVMGALVDLIKSGVYDVVLGSRFLGSERATKGGMPLYKYISNIFLTSIENLLLATSLSEFHTGYRAYSRTALEKVNFQINSDNFIFDNQIIVQFLMAQLRIGEISVPAKYFPEASSIGFLKSCRYGLGVLKVGLLGWLHKNGIFTASFLKC